jgi:DNA-binding transcriptional ArsR family regulator
VARYGRADKHSLLLALQHPLRRKILRAMMADEEPASPCQLTKALDESLSNVSYHVRVLARSGAVKPAGQRRVRGTTQHFYRWAVDAKWARAMLEEGEE